MSEPFSCSLQGIQEQNRKFPKLVVMFTQKDCQPCEYVRNLLSELEGEISAQKDLTDLLKFGFAEVEITDDAECMDLAKELGVTATPTIIEFRNGKEKRRLGVTLDLEKDRESLRQLGQD